MHPSLSGEQAIGEPSLHDERGRQQPGLGSLRRLIHLDAEASTFGPARVHPQHHLGPVLGIGATGAGVHLGDGVGLVVVALEQALDLKATNAPLKLRHRSRQLGNERVVILASIR